MPVSSVFSANIHWLSECCWMSCLILFSVSCFYICLFDELFLDISQKHKAVYQTLFLILSFSEIHQPYRFTLLCVCCRCQMALISSACSLSFETSPPILSIHRNRLVVSLPSPYQLKYGISINRAICLSRQKVKIPDSQIQYKSCSLLNLTWKEKAF